MSSEFEVNCEILREFFFTFCDPQLGNDELLELRTVSLDRLMDLAVGLGVTFHVRSVHDWAIEDVAKGVRELAKILGHDDPSHSYSGWDDFVSQMENLGEDSLFSRLKRH